MSDHKSLQFLIFVTTTTISILISTILIITIVDMMIMKLFK